MFTLFHNSINGEEVFKFETEEEIKTKLVEIENSHAKCEYSIYYAKDDTFDISVTTNPLLLSICLNDVLQSWQSWQSSN